MTNEHIETIGSLFCEMNIVGLLKLDNQGKILFVSDGAKRLIGLPDEHDNNLIGKSLSNLMIEDESVLINALNTNAQQKVAVRLLTTDRHYLWFELLISPVAGGFGVIVHEIGNLKNELDLALEAQEMAVVGSWEVDLIRNTVHWSDVTRKIHEAPEDFVPDLESGINFYREGESRDLITNVVSEAIANGTPFDVELQMVTLKGNLKWVRSIGKAEFKNDKCVRLTGVFQDITESKIKDLNLIENHKKIESKSKELEQFAYIAAHDLQEPLRTIRSFTDKLNERYFDDLDDTGQKMMGFVTSAAERMSVLIHGLLEYSRIGAKSELQEINTQALIEDVLSDLNALMESSGAVVNIDKLPVIQGHPLELGLMFQNLVSNGIKFRKPDVQPEIHISVKSLRDHWQFSVKDNGIGISKEHAQRIFMIFQRLHSRSEYEGSGIGLAHCRKIAELHGGKIWVSSEAGEGSTFYFTIIKK